MVGGGGVVDVYVGFGVNIAGCCGGGVDGGGVSGCDCKGICILYIYIYF